jgi:hypothetical protein
MCHWQGRVFIALVWSTVIKSCEVDNAWPSDVLLASVRRAFGLPDIAAVWCHPDVTGGALALVGGWRSNRTVCIYGQMLGGFLVLWQVELLDCHGASIRCAFAPGMLLKVEETPEVQPVGVHFSAGRCARVLAALCTCALVLLVFWGCLAAVCLAEYGCALLCCCVCCRVWAPILTLLVPQRI